MVKNIKCPNCNTKIPLYHSMWTKTKLVGVCPKCGLSLTMSNKKD